MKWVPYNEHDELVRAMAQIEELESKVEELLNQQNQQSQDDEEYENDR